MKALEVDRQVARRLGIAVDEVTRSHREQVLRDLLAARGRVSRACDPEVIVGAPARGAVGVIHPRETVVTDAGNVRVRAAGRFAGLRVLDAFDKAAVQAGRRKAPAPFAPGQIAVGREYAHLSAVCAASGLSLSQIGGTGGGGDGQGVSEAVLDDMRRLRALLAAIGPGTALTVRRIRPSRRGGTAARPARNISDRDLVHLFCNDGKTLAGVLEARGWSVRGETRNALRAALCAALDRMSGVRVRGSHKRG